MRRTTRSPAPSRGVLTLAALGLTALTALADPTAPANSATPASPATPAGPATASPAPPALASPPQATAPATPASSTPVVARGNPDPGQGAHPGGGAAASVHEPPNALEEKRRALRQAALTEVLAGRAAPYRHGASTVVRLGPTETGGPAAQAGVGAPRARAGDRRHRFAEVGRGKTDQVFVLLAEFGDERHPDFPDQDTDLVTAGPTRFTGPRHNQIPRPDRAVDNSSGWRPDYSADYFRGLYFGTGPGVESLRTYYQTQSSGRYTLTGQVTDWVRVRYNQARYGRSDGYPCPAPICPNVWELVSDALDRWVAQQHARGRTTAQLTADLRRYDQWDRYDHDTDGDFNEPDGYLDHFQLVHAGADQADVDRVYGEDAIWSHRWRVHQDQVGRTGPTFNRAGGVQIGRTGLWVADYTMMPENGGLSVFAHEYGHDLGLPDDYDLFGGDAPVEWWSLMAQSRLSAAGEPIGSRPGDLGAWQKLQLGWLDYEVATAGQHRTVELGPAEYRTSRPQALVVALPKKRLTLRLVDPAAGRFTWWSGSGNNLDATLTRRVTLPAGRAALTFRANWEIEDCATALCDHATVEVNDGGGWKPIPGSITKAAEGHAIAGVSGHWVPATFDLSRYAGSTIDLRFRYVTDPSQGGRGLFVDTVTVTGGGRTLVSEGAETGDGGWVARGFTRVGSTVTREYDNYYIAAYRSYVSYDRYLRTGPYNFGWQSTRPQWVERFPYHPGLLVTYWDTSQPDNNTSLHPGEGLNLVVDAHPEPRYQANDLPWRTRVQLYDAAFSRTRAPSFTLHVEGKPSPVRGLDPQPVFDDTRRYWFPETPLGGVKVRGAGVRIELAGVRGTTATVRLSTSGPAPSPSNSAGAGRTGRPAAPRVRPAAPR